MSSYVLRDTTTTRAPKTRTITLTDRRPVTIREDAWPVIARATDDSYHGSDDGRYQQSLRRGEVDTYHLIVRQHADSRALVYGVRDAAIQEWRQPASGKSWRGGVLLDPGADLVAAIRSVGHEGGLPDPVIRACIADLPAETL